MLPFTVLVQCAKLCVLKESHLIFKKPAGIVIILDKFDIVGVYKSSVQIS